MHCYCQLPLKVMLLLIKTWVQKVFREFNIKIIDEGEPFLYIFDKMIATSGITNNKNLFFFFLANQQFTLLFSNPDTQGRLMTTTNYNSNFICTKLQ